ncbi:pollen-specific leucine-rich repeat extensin-like protein 1 [Lytechinus variegatus]|uniref:pollen-specific leucine-rich repeat extensin-like protein 1 n=1 Tax=Lytechinus variegatus TaxID=7654 RepID=UPI001BB21110|nr:pollen-specific leucine-rich repeat extensin-like protein 1 [Lytechinus variegatus]
MVIVMTSPQPIANHRPPLLPAKPEARPRRPLHLNLEEGQLRKRIHLFEELTNSRSKDEGKGEDTNLRCRQPRVISPDQKRWTQLDFTNDEPGNRKEVSRQKHGQHSMHPGHKRSPLSPPPPPKPLPSPRRKVEIKVPLSEPLVNGKAVVQTKRDRPLTGDTRAVREENVRNSVLAIVSAFENGKSSMAVERKSKMLTVPEGGRIRTSSESTAPNGTMSLTRSGADSLMPPAPLQKNRMSRSMDSLVLEFESVAFDLSQTNTRHKSDGSSSPDSVPRTPSPIFHKPHPVPHKADHGPHRPNPVLPKPDPVPCRPDSVLHKPDLPTHRPNPVLPKPDPVPHRPDSVLHKPDLSALRPDSELHKPHPAPRSLDSVLPKPDSVLHKPHPVPHSPDRVLHKPDPVPHRQDPVSHRPDPVLQKLDPAPHRPDPVPIKQDPVLLEPDPTPAKTDPVTDRRDSITCDANHGPQKPERTFEQDIYNQSKLEQSNGQVLIIVNDEDEEGQNLSRTRLPEPKRTNIQDAYDKSKALRLKHCLSNGDVLRELKTGQPVPRTRSARRADGSPEYYRVNPENCSRNCNHNVETEDNTSLNGYHKYEQVSEVYPKPGKKVVDSLVIDNNNQSSLLNILKSPVSRRPRLASPLPKQAKVHPTSRPPPIPETPPKLPNHPPQRRQPPNLKLISPETVAKERSKLLSPPTSPLEDSGCVSPETQRRMTDSALIPNLSPRTHRRNVEEARRTNLSPIMGEYAEPILIKRSLSDESLATLRRPSPIVDSQGYSVPGSHLWESPKFHTMKPKPVLRREKPPTKLPTHLEVEESRDKSWNGCAQEVMARTTKEAGLGSLDGKKEGFRQRSKLLTVSC